MFFLGGQWLAEHAFFVIKAVTQSYKSGIILWLLTEHSLSIVLNLVH